MYRHGVNSAGPKARRRTVPAGRVRKRWGGVLVARCVPAGGGGTAQLPNSWDPTAEKLNSQLCECCLSRQCAVGGSSIFSGRVYCTRSAAMEVVLK